jgi:hypothetical protein
LKKVVIMSCLTATIIFAQEKTTHHRVHHFSRPLIAATQISPSELPRTYAARDVKILGDLDYGQSSGPVAYSATPTYRAFVFSAFGGENVEVTVRGSDRKAMVALADSGLNRLAIGDTSLRLSLPNRGPYIECWYIVFRDFEKKPARFTVQVKKLQSTNLQSSVQTVPTQ